MRGKAEMKCLGDKMKANRAGGGDPQIVCWGSKEALLTTILTHGVCQKQRETIEADKRSATD